MSTPIAYDFDATQYAPRQTLAAHPPGKFPARITALEAKPTKDAGGGFFAVTFTTQAGTIVKRYNIWNQSQAAVDIAHGELSALSYATRVMRWTMRDNGAALMNAQCVIEVGPQVDKNTGAPNGYNEVKKVFDMNGNDPSAPLTQQAPQGLAPAAQTNPGAFGQSPQPGYGQPGQPQGFPVDTGPMPGQPQPGGAWQQSPQTPATPAPGQGFGQPQPSPAPSWAPQTGGHAQPGPFGQPQQAPQPAQQPGWQQAQGGAAQAPTWSQQR